MNTNGEGFPSGADLMDFSDRTAVVTGGGARGDGIGNGRATAILLARGRERTRVGPRIEGTGWDIGRAVVFLASEHARYITGQALVVDGGVSVLSPVS